jgi:hypothetical protein
LLNNESRPANYVATQPTVEGLYIPITCVFAAFGIAASCLRILTLISGLQSGWLPYLAIGIAVTVSVITTSITRVLDLPKLLHAGAFLITTIIALLLLAFAPSIPGHLYFGGHWAQISLFPYGTGIIGFAWFCAATLSWTVAWVYPTHQRKPEDDVVAQRLRSETELRRIYSGGVHNQMAMEKSGRAAYKALFGLLLAYLIVSLLWPNIEQVRSDVYLAVLSGITITAILAYLALMGLATMRRKLERDAVHQVLPGYQKAWLFGVLWVAVAAGTLSSLLPADISPFAYLDYNAIMNRVTVFIVGLLFRSGQRADYYNLSMSSGAPGYGGMSAPMGGSGGGTSGPVPFLVVFLIPALAYVVYRSVKSLTPSAEMVLSNEKERSRGLWQILGALFTWPWRWLKRRFGSKTQQGRDDTGMESTVLAQLRRSMRNRRRKQYPEDQALYIRYIYARMLQAAAEAGYKRPSQETAYEYAATLSQQVPDAGDALADLTQAYCDVRYTQKEPTETTRSKVIASLRRITAQFRRNRRGLGDREE